MAPSFSYFHILTNSVEQAKLDITHCCQLHWWTSCEQSTSVCEEPSLTLTPVAEDSREEVNIPLAESAFNAEGDEVGHSLCDICDFKSDSKIFFRITKK